MLHLRFNLFAYRTPVLLFGSGEKIGSIEKYNENILHLQDLLHNKKTTEQLSDLPRQRFI